MWFVYLSNMADILACVHRAVTQIGHCCTTLFLQCATTDKPNTGSSEGFPPFFHGHRRFFLRAWKGGGRVEGY